MSPDPHNIISHPDELLPWFVNRTLSPQDQQEVATHIQHCARCQQEVTLLEQMRGHIQSASFESPGEQGLQRLLNQVASEKEAKQPQALAQPHLWWKSLAIAASLIIAVQAGLLMDAWYFSQPMTTLSGPRQEGIILQVSFVPTATEGNIRESLLAIGGTVIDGPSQLGIYRIRLNLQPGHTKTIDEAIESLRQHHSIIRHVARE